MGSIVISRKEFDDDSNGDLNVPFQAAELVRATIAAGRNPQNPPKEDGEQNDYICRENRFKSAVALEGESLKASGHYLASRMTEQGHLTEAVANALCAFAANRVYDVPWLMNIEELHRYVDAPNVEFDLTSKKRTDFIGQGTRGDWYVFESKGRRGKPSDTNLRDWKTQANTVKTINGKEPKYHIVASAYLNADGEWNQILFDPPTDERSISLDFGETDFFRAYYMRLRRRLLLRRIVDETSYGSLYSLGIPKFQVGVHKDFEKAAFEGYASD